MDIVKIFIKLGIPSLLSSLNLEENWGIACTIPTVSELSRQSERNNWWCSRCNWSAVLNGRIKRDVSTCGALLNRYVNVFYRSKAVSVVCRCWLLERGLKFSASSEFVYKTFLHLQTDITPIQYTNRQTNLYSIFTDALGFGGDILLRTGAECVEIIAPRAGWREILKSSYTSTAWQLLHVS